MVPNKVFESIKIYLKILNIYIYICILIYVSLGMLQTCEIT